MEDKYNGLHVYKAGEVVSKTLPTENDFLEEEIDREKDDYKYSDEFEDYELEEKPKKPSKIGSLVSGLFKKKERYQGKYLDPVDDFLRHKPSLFSDDDEIEDDDTFDDEPIFQGRGRITQFRVRSSNVSKLNDPYTLSSESMVVYHSTLGESMDKDSEHKIHR